MSPGYCYVSSICWSRSSEARNSVRIGSTRSNEIILNSNHGVIRGAWQGVTGKYLILQVDSICCSIIPVPPWPFGL